MKRIIRIRFRRLFFTFLSAFVHSACTGYMLMLVIGGVAVTGFNNIMFLLVPAVAISASVVFVLGFIPGVEKVFFSLANIFSCMVMTIYIIPFAVGCHC